MQQISDYELTLMKIIWAKGGCAMYADIAQTLSDMGTPWTKNTIITLLSRLIGKGYLATSKIGRRNEYTALICEGAYQGIQTEAFLDKIYEGNAKGLVSTLIQKELLSPEDYEELYSHWQKGARNP